MFNFCAPGPAQYKAGFEGHSGLEFQENSFLELFLENVCDIYLNNFFTPYLYIAYVEHK